MYIPPPGALQLLYIHRAGAGETKRSRQARGQAAVTYGNAGFGRPGLALALALLSFRPWKILPRPRKDPHRYGRVAVRVIVAFFYVDPSRGRVCHVDLLLCEKEERKNKNKNTSWGRSLYRVGRAVPTRQWCVMNGGIRGGRRAVLIRSSDPKWLCWFGWSEACGLPAGGGYPS